MFNSNYTIMKKSLIIAALALTTLSATAQTSAYLNTYEGNDLTKYTGKTLKITTSRYMYNGWNTVCFPFSMTENEINEVFGSDCRLETLTGVSYDNTSVRLDFSDVKKLGIEANKPYILYYSGENKTVSIRLENKEIKDADKSISINGATFSGTKKHIDGEGFYGILARDNKEASFVSVGTGTNGFYATRCFLNLEGVSNKVVITNHVSGATGIASLKEDGQSSDVYNLAGQKTTGLNKGVNIVNGKKVLVK